MTHCPFCNKKFYINPNYLGSCENHNMIIKFYTQFNLIEFYVDNYILCYYSDKISIFYKGRFYDTLIYSALGSFNITPDNVSSIIQKFIKLNAFL